jgi:RNase P/RNase MRP subunit p29
MVQGTEGRIINGSDYVMYPLNTQSEYKGARGKIIANTAHFLVVERFKNKYKIIIFICAIFDFAASYLKINLKKIFLQFTLFLI